MYETSDGRYVEITAQRWWDTAEELTLVDTNTVKRHMSENPALRYIPATKSEADYKAKCKEAAIEQMLQLRNSGKSFADIGEAYGIRADKVRIILTKKAREDELKAQGGPRSELSTRAFTALSIYLGSRNWQKSDVASVDLEELKRMPNCGNVTYKELEKYIIEERAAIKNRELLNTDSDIESPSFNGP